MLAGKRIDIFLAINLIRGVYFSIKSFFCLTVSLLDFTSLKLIVWVNIEGTVDSVLNFS